MRRLSGYERFLGSKLQYGGESGFEAAPPGWLFDFQSELFRFAVEKGRAAIFADCGLGKTAVELAWSDAVATESNGRVLLLTPLAVGHQTIAEGKKFGVDCSRDGAARIVVANYERLHHFSPADFTGVVCDESSILKSFDGKTRKALTEFMRTIPYRLLATATAAPNDYIELGTSSEALGEMGHVDMLNRFFANDQNTSDLRRKWRAQNGGDGARQRWRFKGHAEDEFWRWVCSWARACRRPSDLGFSDERFELPSLTENHHVVEARTLPPGMLFPSPAVGLREQREERKRTIQERCEKAAELVDHGESAVVWCHYNAEGDKLEKLIPDAVQVSGRDSEESKVEAYQRFASGDIRVIVTKPKIGAWGLNWQHCAHVVTFATHSYEQHYQAVRRCWRFGQRRPVTVDIISTEGEAEVARNLQRKSEAADRMFESLVEHMTSSLEIERSRPDEVPMEAPSWL